MCTKCPLVAVCCVLGLSALTKSTAQQDPGAAPRSHDGALAEKVRTEDYARFESHGAKTGDVEALRGLLRELVVRLRAEFGAEPVDRLLTGIDCTVHVWGAPTAKVDEASASVETSTVDGRYRADLHLLAPSAFRASFRSAAGDGPGPDHDSKTLAHEYSTLLLDRLTREKPQGWRFFSAPGWFVQGYEEYAAITLSRPRNRDLVLPAYLRLQQDDRVRFGAEIEVQDVYVDGALLLHFLHDRYGRERVQAVLTSPLPTFAAALPAALGASLPELADAWRTWRADAVRRSAWQDVVRAASTDGDIAAAVVEQDLEHLPMAIRDKVIDALRRLAGKQEYWRRYEDGSPRRLIRVEAGATRWVLVVTYEGMEVPGYSWMAVHLFDGNWKQTAVDRFPTGYRIALFDVWSETVEALPGRALVVRLGSVGSFGDFTYRQRQYYAIREDRVALVRLEEEGKGLAQGVFSASRPWTGPRPPLRTPAEWLAALGSGDPAAVLETLVWLDGHHLGAAERREVNVNQESAADSALWETVRDDPRTRELRKELAASPLRWVREAAR